MRLLDDVRAGKVTSEDAASELGALPYAEVAEAVVVDHHRELRTGVPELVYGASKTAAQIAAPTSVGYGVAFDGLGALGALLAACAPGISVVDIDNGVGAAVAAVKIARLAVRA